MQEKNVVMFGPRKQNFVSKGGHTLLYMMQPVHSQRVGRAGGLEAVCMGVICVALPHNSILPHNVYVSPALSAGQAASHSVLMP